MTLDLPSLGHLVWRSLQEPQAVADELISLRLGRGTLWTALILVTVVSVLLLGVMQGGTFVLPVTIDSAIQISPFAYTLILGASLVVTTVALHWTGRALGGTGDFDGALTVIVWLEVVAIALRAVQVVVFLFSPGLAAIAGLLAVAVLFWCMLNFVNALHGFDSLGRSLLVMVLAVVGIALGATLILSVVGVGAGGVADV